MPDIVARRRNGRILEWARFQKIEANPQVLYKQVLYKSGRLASRGIISGRAKRPKPAPVAATTIYSPRRLR